MNEDNLKNFIAAVGAIAECTALFYEQLIEHDVPNDHAAMMTLTFIQQITPKSTAQSD